ncbi:cell division protein FtsA [Tumebacillus algifaecis]|uniref:Cell division protein FtsA n=1 Tax=Tumebacillus algifaecis TaxID=1214604 RepID=A0A223D2V0_9BACL|nr:cell division protein FtsA [Tumebacillus algifaecis]ASS75861.1 cell division protein FtsA [Tumebacillus algifaecis]
MTNGDIIVSLDIGTSKVRAIIGEVTGTEIQIIGVGSADGDGIRKGAIVDIDKTVQSIRAAIDHAERMVGIQISSAYIGISGNHISLQNSHGVVAVNSPNREIGEEDIDRVLQASRVIALPPEREIIDVVPKGYVVDGLTDISDPRGMIGVRLEVEAYIITGSRTIIHNLVRCVERAGVQIAGLVLSPLSAGTVALTNDEKKLGVGLIDLGAGQTTVSVFKEGILEATTVLPVGGDHVTNDIAIGLRTQTEAAEGIKLRHACALVSESVQDHTFKVSRVGGNADKEFTQVDLAHIIEPRLQEIFMMVRQEMEKLGYKELAGGYVLTGGGANLPAVDKLAEFELESSVRVAIPEFLGVKDASFINGVGIIRNVARNFTNKVEVAAAAPRRKAGGNQGGGFVEKIKNWFNEFI